MRKLSFFIFLVVAITGMSRFLANTSNWLPAVIERFGENAGSIPMDSLAQARIQPISTIQGAGEKSLLEGKWVTIEAVVTGDFQSAGLGENGDLDGFYVQEELADQDNNPQTSEGLFIYDGSKPKVNVTPGDRVRLRGLVKEYHGETELDVRKGKVIRLSGREVVAPITIPFPFPSTRKNSDDEFIADLEPWEGMLVTLPEPLTITGVGNLDRFGEIALSAQGRIFAYTEVHPPDNNGFLDYLNRTAQKRIILDDGSKERNPEAPLFDESNRAVKVGEELRSVTGILRYSRSAGKYGKEAFRVEPVKPVELLRNNIKGSVQFEPQDRVKGEVRVAGLNVQNFFTTLNRKGERCFPTMSRKSCRGPKNKTQYERKLSRLLKQMQILNADAYALMELENNGSGSESAIGMLAAALNQTNSSGCTSYQAVDTGERLGGDAIKVGIIYCAKRLRIAQHSHVAIETGASGKGNRPSLAVSFQDKVNNEVFTLVVVHFKSKGPSGLNRGTVCLSSPMSNPDCDQLDGQGFWNARRTGQAKQLMNWLKKEPTGVDDPDVLILGDFNSYSKEDPIRVLTNSGYISAVDLFSGNPDYSYVYDGMSGSLDHALVSRSFLSQIHGAAHWHVNADWPLSSQNQRASDHDPLVVSLILARVDR